ncbi:MAG: EF-hand domain-containing protein [bacterium]
MQDDELEELKELFDFYDRDGNGVVDRDEFARLCRALDDGFSEAELAAGLDAVDQNRQRRDRVQRVRGLVARPRLTPSPAQLAHRLARARVPAAFTWAHCPTLRALAASPPMA